MLFLPHDVANTLYQNINEARKHARDRPRGTAVDTADFTIFLEPAMSTSASTALGLISGAVARATNFVVVAVTSFVVVVGVTNFVVAAGFVDLVVIEVEDAGGVWPAVVVLTSS